MTKKIRWQIRFSAIAHLQKAPNTTNLEIVPNSQSSAYTVPEMFYFPTWMVSEQWAICEWTVNARWTNAEWTQSERCLNAEHKLLNDMWTLNESEHERSANASAIWTVNARWTNDEHFIRKVSGIFLALYLTSNLVKIDMYELLNFVILLRHIYFWYKRTAWNKYN